MLQENRGSHHLTARSPAPEGAYPMTDIEPKPATHRNSLRAEPKTGKRSFDARRAERQNLTFEYAEMVFRHHRIPFGAERYPLLEMVASDGSFSNVALLLSDQNPYAMQCASFNDEASLEFICRQNSRARFSNSLRKRSGSCASPTTCAPTFPVTRV